MQPIALTPEIIDASPFVSWEEAKNFIDNTHLSPLPYFEVAGCTYIYPVGWANVCAEKTRQDTLEIALPDAADHFGIPYQTLVSAVKTGRVPARKAGPRAWLVTMQAIREAISTGKLRQPRL